MAIDELEEENEIFGGGEEREVMKLSSKNEVQISAPSPEHNHQDTFIHYGR